LDDLPDAYDQETWERKAGIVFDHIFASYYDNGGSVYAGGPDLMKPAAERAAVARTSPAQAAAKALDVDEVTAAVIEEIKSDPGFAELVAEQLRGEKAFFAVPTEELIAKEETFDVEFKSTARWNLVEERKDKRMEDAIVKAVAGFLNADGGTLLIGVADDGRVMGLASDLPLVTPKSTDGLVNWLTTHLVNALSHSAVMRTRARIDRLNGGEVCRIDVARSSAPVLARMSDGAEVFWVRMNNSTRGLPEIEVASYVRDRWPEGPRLNA
jgi:type I restriction enzyme R subunit